MNEAEAGFWLSGGRNMKIPFRVFRYSEGDFCLIIWNNRENIVETW